MEGISTQLETSNSVTRDGLVSTIQTTEGVISLRYEIHRQPPEQTIPYEQIDGVAIEDADGYYTDPQMVRILISILHPTFSEEAKKREIPFYGIDCKEKYPKIFTVITDNTLVAVEAGLSFKLFIELLSKLRAERTSRRNFLKLSVIGGLIGVGWLSTPALSRFTQIISTLKQENFDLSSNLLKANNFIHPEIGIATVTGRNLIMAQKLIYILSATNSRHIGMNIGAGHVGIEEALQMKEEDRLGFISQLAPVLKEVFLNEYLYQIMEYNFDSTTQLWQHQLTEDPKLAAIFNQ